jgi:hypothetical protein
VTETIAFQYISWRGATVDRKTVELLKIAERRLDYEVDVIKGHSVSTTTGVSSTTHNKGGVCDIKPFDHERKVKVLRDLGCAAWFRDAIPGLWEEHIHFVVIRHGNLDPAAARQVESYLRGRDGLKGDNIDPNKYHPAFSDFSYEAALKDNELRARIKKDQLDIARARAGLTYKP